jgi:hypothetical protein
MVEPLLVNIVVMHEVSMYDNQCVVIVIFVAFLFIVFQSVWDGVPER